jgi:hypothetical protein
MIIIHHPIFMKRLLSIIACLTTFFAQAQTLQLHYDLRHTLDPKNNDKNYPTLYFEYLKTLDSGKYFIKPGSFFLKLQADLNGDRHNMGNYFMQVSQEVKFWRPKVFINLQYGGGLGVTNPKQYSYYIANTFSVGISRPFKIGSAFFSSILSYRFTPYTKPSNDIGYTMYFYKGLWNYKAEISGSFTAWTENKNHGDVLTDKSKGKSLHFFAEPQFWYNMNKTVAFGTKVNAYRHVLTIDNTVQLYPTLAIRCRL